MLKLFLCRLFGLAFVATTLTSFAGNVPVEYDFNAMLQPVPLTAKWADTNYNIWCGSAVKGDDGKFHLFYSRWPRKLGHQAWASYSEIAHAVSDTPFGPWTHHDVTLPARGTNFWDGSCTHNPTILRIGKKYYLYYMGNYGDGVVTGSLNWTHRNHQRIGVAVADSPNGPWQRFDKPIVDISSDTNAPDALLTSNPSVAQRPDGGVLMVYKAVAKKGKAPFGGPVSHLVATADNPTGPFTKHPGEVFGAKGVMFAAEDPFIWRGADRYWAIVKDNDGNFTQRGYSLALWESADGFDWKLSQHPFVANPGSIRWADGHEEKFTALERPQLVFENGEPVALCCAAADNKARDGSFNVQIPLKRANAGERRQSLDGFWQFTTNAEAATWDSITVPGNWDTLPQYSTHKGKGWYRREFVTPADWSGQHIRLKFDAVYHDATVTLNGQELGGHNGGYTPFEFDVTGVVKLGAVNTAAVGSYPIVPSAATGSGLGNYTLTYNNGTLTVLQSNTFVGASSTMNPSGYKDAISFLATLPADASGNVVFFSTNGPISTNALSSGSATSLSVTNLPRGTNVITFAYAGDGNYLGSTNTLNQIVTNHPPVANDAAYARSAAVNSFKIAVTNLLSHASDVDSDTLTLTVGASTNSALVMVGGGYVLYYNTNAVPDQFTYTVADGFGGTNSATVSITVDTTPIFGQSTIADTSGGTATLNFAGIPGYSYSVRRSTNLVSWTVIWTTNAPAGGAFQFIDDPAPQPNAYYRLQYNP